jgi:hypothetical protein
MTELRPCPFCWALGADLAVTDISPDTWAVVCTECGAQGPSNHLVEDESDKEPNTTADQAVTEWNMRA